MFNSLFLCSSIFKNNIINAWLRFALPQLCIASPHCIHGIHWFDILSIMLKQRNRGWNEAISPKTLKRGEDCAKDENEKIKRRECRRFGGGLLQPSLELKTVMTFLAALFRIERFGRFVCLLFVLFKRGIEYCRGLSKNEKEKA
jgi:hypothetical protein